MIDDLTWLESLIQSKIPDRLVFKDAVNQDGAEIQIENLPSRRPALVRVLFRESDALAIRASTELAGAIGSDIAQIMSRSDSADEIIVDLRDVERRQSLDAANESGEMKPHAAETIAALAKHTLYTYGQGSAARQRIGRLLIRTGGLPVDALARLLTSLFALRQRPSH